MSPIRPCEGVRSPSDAVSRPAAICRNCQRRIVWQRGERAAQIKPAATFAGGALLRLSCSNKVR